MSYFGPADPFTILEIGKKRISSGFRWRLLLDKMSHDL